MTRRQKTLRTAVEITGVGIHSGDTVRARILPAPPGTGIHFIRTDLPEAPSVPAHISFHSPKDRRTRLLHDGAVVETVEHFLAACSGFEIDNLKVELSAPEFPALDGSALPLIEYFKQAGTAEQREDVKVFKLEEPVYVRDGESTLVALPTDADGLELEYVATFDDAADYSGSYRALITPEVFEREIAPARTFALASEVEALRAAGFGKGATRENTLIVGEPDTEYRLPMEAVRHKVLDLIGDLRLLGAQLCAQVIATRSGHKSNAELVRRLLGVMQAQETGGSIQRESAMDIREILRMLPHRYPFLMIDRVIEIEGYNRAVAVKNVSINEPFFQGHFPDMPLMPGVLQLEAMAQLAGMLLLRKLEYTGKLAVLWSIDKVKLRGAVAPGDQLRIEVETVRMKGQTAQVRGKGTVAGQLACEATLMFTMIDA